ncbi:MAG: hypothetical protein WBP58_15490 [Chitinophagaceae bacterium]
MMNILELNPRSDLQNDPKTAAAFSQFSDMLKAVKEKELNTTVVASLNEGIESINNSLLTGKDLTKHIKSKQQGILKLLEKEQKIVPKNYYRTLWMLLGMTSFGLPLGVAFGMAMGNIGLLGLGLPNGMAIGLAVGTSMDKKAAAEGRQLAFEVKM